MVADDMAGNISSLRRESNPQPREVEARRSVLLSYGGRDCDERRAKELNLRVVVPGTGFEAASPPWRCPPQWWLGAGCRTRTRVACLQDRCSTC